MSSFSLYIAFLISIFVIGSVVGYIFGWAAKHDKLVKEMNDCINLDQYSTELFYVKDKKHADLQIACLLERRKWRLIEKACMYASTSDNVYSDYAASRLKFRRAVDELLKYEEEL